MDRILRPERLDIDLQDKSNSASDTFRHWKRTLENFISELKEAYRTEEKKYNVLVNHVSPSIFKTISNESKYTEAMTILQNMFVKTKNDSFARFLLSKRAQKDSEDLSQYMVELETLSRDCNFTEVTAEVYRQESIRTAFISGIRSNQIRQRLTEKLQ